MAMSTSACMSTKLSPVLPSAIPPMTETASPQASDQPDWPTEVARLNKIIEALMDRAERNTSAQQSDFGVFQTTIMLEERVRRRTAELEAALHENEKINRACLLYTSPSPRDRT